MSHLGMVGDSRVWSDLCSTETFNFLPNTYIEIKKCNKIIKFVVWHRKHNWPFGCKPKHYMDFWKSGVGGRTVVGECDV